MKPVKSGGSDIATGTETLSCGVIHVRGNVSDPVERYRRLVEGVGDEYCIYSVDPQGNWLYLSPSSQHVFGYAPHLLLGTNWREIAPPDFIEIADHHERESRRGKTPPAYQVRYRHPDGTERHFQVNERPVVDDKGVVVAIEGIIKDITQRIYSETELKRAHAEMKKLNSELELRVSERTQKLEQEVEVRRRAEKDLTRALSELSALKARLEAENVYLQEEIERAHDFHEMVGQSEALKKVLRRIPPVASTDATVLIQGETGTGKELVARAVHNASRRKDRPLVAVNCAALPGTLIESELFGHEKGAFTGATSKKLGRFEVADGGTIFLDEIGELPLDLQGKLLRVLQEGEFERLGSSQKKKVDVRVIAATNQDLQDGVSRGTFRADLYYRLSVFPICVPPLRERKEDIQLLVWHFIKRLQARWGRTITEVPPDVMKSLETYSWPGNVRELENVIERATILAQGPCITMEEIPSNQDEEGHASSNTGGTQPMNIEEVERRHILYVLEECNWKVAGKGNAADRIGLHVSTLRSRMKKLGIKRPAG